jgi:hypothetical protein
MRDPQVLAEVKETLALLTERSPGRAIEVRIPPYAALHCGIRRNAVKAQHIPAELQPMSLRWMPRLGWPSPTVKNNGQRQWLKASLLPQEYALI